MAMMRFLERILENPTVYALSQAPFIEEKFAVIARHLRPQQVRRILDVGCGPGINATRFPGAEYVGLDINEQYLAVARSKYRGEFIQADLRTADLSALGTFDTILVNSLLHHVADDEARGILRQLHRALAPDGVVHILELMKPEQGSLVGIMAYVDRGRYPRRLAAWRTLFEEYFDCLSLEPHHFKKGLWSQLYFGGKRKPLS